MIDEEKYYYKMIKSQPRTIKKLKKSLEIKFTPPDPVAKRWEAKICGEVPVNLDKSVEKEVKPVKVEKVEVKVEKVEVKVEKKAEIAVQIGTTVSTV